MSTLRLVQRLHSYLFLPGNEDSFKKDTIKPFNYNENDNAQNSHQPQDLMQYLIQGLLLSSPAHAL